jgi:hypothetical protein
MDREDAPCMHSGSVRTFSIDVECQVQETGVPNPWVCARRPRAV